MKKMFLIGCCTLIAPLALVADAKPQTAETNGLARVGGWVFRRPRKTNHIYFVNAQNKVSSNLVDKAIRSFEARLRTPVEYADGKFELPDPKIVGVMSLYIIDDDSLPPSLIAPEGGWGCVNVAKLSNGRGQQKSFFEARFHKACMRTAAMLFGGLESSARSNLFSHISGIEDYDKIDADAMPPDVLMRCSRMLNTLGVRPFRMATYYRACEEGWAPAPTNDIQKAIWDKVHAMPTAPIKIKPETKKVRD